VKYGVFKHYLLGLTAVLPNGAIVKLGGNTVKKCHRLRPASDIMRLRGYPGSDNTGYITSFTAVAVAPDGGGRF